MPAVGVGLTNLEPTTLEGYDLPIGSNTIVALNAVCRNPECFPNPEEFDPYRWSRTADTAAHKGRASRDPYLLAFGGGARVCPGKHLSIMEGALCLCAMVSQFEISVVPTKGEVDSVFSLRLFGWMFLFLVMTNRFTAVPRNLKLKLSPLKN